MALTRATGGGRGCQPCATSLASLITPPSPPLLIQHDSVPPNVRFEIADIEQPWSFTYPFDLIFSRFMTGAVGNWRGYIEQCYEWVIPVDDSSR